MLLEGNIAVDGQENVELFFGECEQFAVLDASPPCLGNRSYRASDQFACESSIDTLIQQNSHRAAAMASSLPCSRKAIVCSRFTVGNPSRNSSSDSPASI